ncbi:MAG: hypothetical protein CL666_05305 [Balneola sp.]|nr:hypothetical protein [Balneola sp.]|tara:strand:- start:59852 stop:60337 length:486 start_codon:yes stop_codon:yes gene_type:complete
MNKYSLLHFYWLIPAYLLFLVVQQGLVYQGAKSTYDNGETYLAEITDFEIKQIAAQSNGYVNIRFEAEGDTIERRMTLSVQMAQQLMKSNTIPVRYEKGAFQEIVLFPTYDIQRSTSLYNMGVAFLGLAVTVFFGFFVNRYIRRKTINADDEKFTIERVDS